MNKMLKLFGLLALSFVCLPMMAQESDAQNETDTNDQTVNVRYDIQKVFGLTSSVSTIYASELENEYVNNVGNILAGKFAGLYTAISSGLPEATSSFYVRGRNSYNNAGAIVFIDGVQSTINNISLSEIESISVLKDAAALSLFGLNGSGGVIYITTKRGCEGKIKTNVTFRQGWQQATYIPEFVDSYTFASRYNEALSNDNGAWTQFYTDDQLSAYKGNKAGIENYDVLYPNVNWYDEVYNKFAPVTSAEVTFRGGNNNVKYFAMLGYQGVKGLYKGTDKSRDINSNLDDQKFNFRINLDANISKVFYLKTNLAGVIRNQYRPYSGAGNTIWQLCRTIPANAMAVRNEKGWGGNAQYTDNPVADVLETGYYENHNRVLDANFTLGQNFDFITKGLSLEENIAIYEVHQQITNKYKTYQTFAPVATADGLSYKEYGTQATQFTIAATGNGNNAMTTRLQEEVVLRYNRTFNEHTVHATAAFHNDVYTIENLRMPEITRGFAGRVGYSFKDKLFTEFDWSYMGQSSYNPAHNMGFFPVGSLAYVFVNNDSSKGVNFLKLRASTGLTGLSDLSTASNYFMYQQYYDKHTVGPKFNWSGADGKSSLFESYQANANAEWETLWRSDLALEANLFGNRLSFVVDGFYDKNTGILTTATVPGYYGILSDTNINDGVVVNYGVDFNLKWADKLGCFSYSFAPNFGFAKNVIVNKNEAPTVYNYMRITGNEVGTPLLYVADGFYQSQAEIDALPSTLSDVRPGDIKYKDLNNDGKIDSNDRTYDHGFFSSLPQITYGFTLKAACKGFDLEVDAYGVGNRSIDTYNVMTQAFSNGLNNISATAANNRWAYYPEQGIDTRATATYPRLTLGSNGNNTVASTFWYKSGAFMRISNISLGYTIPSNITGKVKVDTFRIYAAVSNPCVFSGLEFDPQSVANYSMMRTFKFGINLNF